MRLFKSGSREFHALVVKDILTQATLLWDKITDITIVPAADGSPLYFDLCFAGSYLKLRGVLLYDAEFVEWMVYCHKCSMYYRVYGSAEEKKKEVDFHRNRECIKNE